MINLKVLGMSLISVLFASVANAGTVTSGSVYNNTAGEFSVDYVVGLMSDQSGLSGNYVDGVTDFATFTASGVTHATQEGAGGVTWLSNGIPSFPFDLDFDLGAEMDIQSLALWNGTSGNDAAINSFDVFTSSTSDFAVATLVGSFNNPIGVDTPEPVTVFSLTPSTGRYVRLVVNSYYGNGCCAGIGEVAFDVNAAAVVAEPIPSMSTYGMLVMILGLMLLAAYGHSRNRVKQ